MKKLELEIAPIDIEGKRINFEDLLKHKTGTRRYFESWGFLWQLNHAKWSFFLSEGKPHIQLLIGSYSIRSMMELHDGESKQITIVAIGKSVPKRIRDVILYHELREIFWRLRENKSLEEAHAAARNDESKYVHKFLSDFEINLYRHLLQSATDDQKWLAKPVPPNIKKIKDAVFL